MSSRPLTVRDDERFPGVDFRAVGSASTPSPWWFRATSGRAACAASVATRCAALRGRSRNWRELGGPDQRVVFFNKEPGRGTWEVFAHWLYGGCDDAPLVSLPEVGSNEEARSKVAATRGAVTQLSAAWADGERTFALAICVGGAARCSRRPKASRPAPTRWRGRSSSSPTGPPRGARQGADRLHARRRAVRLWSSATATPRSGAPPAAGLGARRVKGGWMRWASSARRSRAGLRAGARGAALVVESLPVWRHQAAPISRAPCGTPAPRASGRCR